MGGEQGEVEDGAAGAGGERVEVRFTDRALEDWRQAFPDAPAGDEVALFILLEPCVYCGREMSGLGGFDPEGITEEGQLTGKHVCEGCMREGK